MTATLCEALRSACLDVGILYRDIPADGRWHATDVKGDRAGKGDGRIKLFPDGEGGIVANWKGGTRAFFANDGRTLNPEERAELVRKRREAIRRNQEEAVRRRAEAAGKATDIWAKAIDAPNEKGRDRLATGATQKDKTAPRHSTEIDPLAGWFALARESGAYRQSKRQRRSARR